MSDIQQIQLIVEPAAVRGDHKESIFCDDDDRRLFRSILEEACEKTAWQIHSFCLHFSWGQVWQFPVLDRTVSEPASISNRAVKTTNKHQ